MTTIQPVPPIYPVPPIRREKPKKPVVPNPKPKRALAAILLLLLLSGCGGDSGARSVPSPSGGTIGPKGDTGDQGTQGPAGQDAEIYRLLDSSGTTLPGVLVYGGATTGLWDESEETTAVYTCQNQNYCGMAESILYYTTTDCTGSPYTSFNEELTNARRVFAARGQRWLVPTTSIPTITAEGSYWYHDTCQPYPGTQNAYAIVAYSGDFPLLSPGPWTIR